MLLLSVVDDGTANNGVVLCCCQRCTCAKFHPLAGRQLCSVSSILPYFSTLGKNFLASTSCRTFLKVRTDMCHGTDVDWSRRLVNLRLIGQPQVDWSWRMANQAGVVEAPSHLVTWSDHQQAVPVTLYSVGTCCCKFCS